MSADIYSNGKGEYSLDQLPDFYPLDPDELDSNVEVHTLPRAEMRTSFSKA